MVPNDAKLNVTILGKEKRAPFGNDKRRIGCPNRKPLIKIIVTSHGLNLNKVQAS